MEKELKDFFFYECEQTGNTDCKIDNIVIFDTENKIYATADLSYTWRLNAWNKTVEHEGMIFAFIDGKWKCPLFLS